MVRAKSGAENQRGTAKGKARGHAHHERDGGDMRQNRLERTNSHDAWSFVSGAESPAIPVWNGGGSASWGPTVGDEP